MTYFGTITSYDAGTQSGTIKPDHGGTILSFTKLDLEDAHDPRVNQRYGYETAKSDDGKRQAISLRQRGEKKLREDQAKDQKG